MLNLEVSSTAPSRNHLLITGRELPHQCRRFDPMGMQCMSDIHKAFAFPASFVSKLYGED
jgi:hypothetical protein